MGTGDSEKSENPDEYWRNQYRLWASDIETSKGDTIEFAVYLQENRKIEDLEGFVLSHPAPRKAANITPREGLVYTIAISRDDAYEFMFKIKAQKGLVERMEFVQSYNASELFPVDAKNKRRKSGFNPKF